MTTYTAYTTLMGETAAMALSDALERLSPEPTGVGTFEIEDGSGLWEIGAYFVERPDEAGLALLAVIHDAKEFVVSKVEDRDWVAQVRRELTPVEAGRFVVFGSHDADTISENRIGLVIDAAMAFGTGHHGTTQGCLESLDALVRSGMIASNVADIGAGTGVLAMAASKVFNGQTIASDIDQIATTTAKANILANKLGQRVQCVTSVGFQHEALRARAPFDLVFANILAKPLKGLARDMARFTASGSVIVLSGLLNRQAPGVARVYEGHGFRLQRKIDIGEWTTLTMRRHSALPI